MRRKPAREEMSAPKPIVAFDGECGFCRRAVARWRHLTGGRIDFRPAREMVRDGQPIPSELLSENVVMIEANGDCTHGAHAVFRVMSYVPGRRWLLWLYHNVPGFAAISERGYRWIARNRSRLSG